MQNAYSNSHSYEYDLCLIHSSTFLSLPKFFFFLSHVSILFCFLLCVCVRVAWIPVKNALNLRTSYSELLDCLYSLALSLYILIAMIFSVLVTYSNRLCHLHCPSYHAKLKIIVLSTILDSLTLAQEITDNLQFLILRDRYAHLDGYLQNSATITLPRKESILEDCICQALQLLHFLMPP